MKRILILLILPLTPIGVAAQQSFSNKTLDEKYIINKSEIKTNQQSQSNSQFWLNFGPGIGTLGNGSIAINGSINYQFGKNLFTLRYSSVGEVLGDDFYDVGLLYGRATTRESIQFSFAAGLALVKGTRGEFLGSQEEISTIGFPIELQAHWELISFLGLGITGFANLNPEQSFAGINFTLHVGKLR